MPWRTLGSIFLSRRDVAAENRNGSRTLYCATAWRRGRHCVRNSITAIGSPFWPVTNLFRLYRSAIKAATFKTGMATPEMRSVPTVTRWIADKKPSRLSPASLMSPKREDFGKRTWLKYVTAWSIGWAPVLLGKALGWLVSHHLKHDTESLLGSNICAHLLSVCDLNKEWLNAIILSIADQTSHHNCHHYSSTSCSGWGHDSIDVSALVTQRHKLAEAIIFPTYFASSAEGVWRSISPPGRIVAVVWRLRASSPWLTSVSMKCPLYIDTSDPNHPGQSALHSFLLIKLTLSQISWQLG